MENKKNCWVIPTGKPSRLHYFTANKAGYYLYPNNELVVPRNPNCINQNIYITSDEEIKEGDWSFDIRGFIEKVDETYDLEVINALGKKIILTTDQSLDGVQAIDDEFLEWFVKNPSCKEVEVKYSYPTIDNEGDGSISEGYWLLIIPEENKIYRECPNGCRGKLSYLNKDICLCSCGTKWNIETNKIIIPKEELSTKLHIGEVVDESYPEAFRKEEPKQETTLEEAAEKNFRDKTERIPVPTSLWMNSKDLQVYNFIEGAKWQQQNSYSEEDLIGNNNNSLDTFLLNSSKYTQEERETIMESVVEWFEQFKKK